MNLIDYAVCEKHGWFAHVGIHEAGHATVACLLGFDFVDVSIFPASAVFEHVAPGDSAAAGGLRMTSDRPTEWVGPRQEDALVMLVSGSLAEREILGDHVQDGHKGDIEIWRRGSGLVEAVDPKDIAPLVKAATATARGLVAQHRDQIMSVYRLFAGRAPTRGGVVLPFSEAIVLPYSLIRDTVLSR